MIQLFGRWNLEVTEAIHSWENRFRVQGTTAGDGTYPPTIGTSVTADGAAWVLVAEHRPSPSDPWTTSDMMMDTGIDRVDISATIGAEDPLPQPDFEDIQWRADFLDGTLYDVPRRPYAVRPQDLMEMPDGLFETALGTYYMAVHVENQWGLPFDPDHVLDISPASRADLAMRGIQVIDSWSQTELAAVGQIQFGTGMSLGGLVPGGSRTVYFKVDVSAASPRKHAVEFVLRNLSGMADPDHPTRRVTRQIFVCRTTIDSTTGEIVSEVRQGQLRLKLHEIAVDTVNGKAGRRPCRRPGRNRRRHQQDLLDELRTTLDAILSGKGIDPCKLQHLLACACSGVDTPGGGSGGELDPWNPSDGRFCYDPFWAFPTRFSYSVIPSAPFAGQYGPIPYDDPWWKVLLLVIAAILLLAGALAEGADIAYQDEDLVIGTLGQTSQNDIDAALCVLDTDRATAMMRTLDAQSDEDFQNAVVALDGDIDLVGPVMTRAELDAIMLLPTTDPQRQVHKSGARTGVTHGIMTGFAMLGHPESTWSIDQLTIQTDPVFDEPVSRGGDSGSIWVHTATLRPVALHHSGTDDDTLGRASLLEDVQNRLNITI